MDSGRTGILGFFSRRWRGEEPLARLFWFDMVVVGTAINVLTLVGSLVALAADAPLWLVLAIHLSPLPYNLFLFVAVWRSAQHAPAAAASAAKTGATIWLIAAFFI